ncbi:Hypothetical predicted protein [Pelobates cultripes]|uniref:Uncharacterized protein n=1 Tax=Pelobates cultripes TaxID=61616 RepID=A0AAD1S7T0_PELCU|nr:Hypothetical predicted protein [Pelobates cultripes]
MADAQPNEDHALPEYRLSPDESLNTRLQKLLEYFWVRVEARHAATQIRAQANRGAKQTRESDSRREPSGPLGINPTKLTTSQQTSPSGLKALRGEAPRYPPHRRRPIRRRRRNTTTAPRPTPMGKDPTYKRPRARGETILALQQSRSRGVNPAYPWLPATIWTYPTQPLQLPPRSIG